MAAMAAHLRQTTRPDIHLHLLSLTTRATRLLLLEEIMAKIASHPSRRSAGASSDFNEYPRLGCVYGATKLTAPNNMAAGSRLNRLSY